MIAAPKPRSPAQLRAAEKRQQAKADALVYAAVTRRDSGRCRVFGCREPGQMHHLIYRSRGGQTHTNNVLSLCRIHHAAVHAGLIHVAGDANTAIVVRQRVGEEWTETTSDHTTRARRSSSRLGT